MKPGSRRVMGLPDPRCSLTVRPANAGAGRFPFNLPALFLIFLFGEKTQ